MGNKRIVAVKRIRFNTKWYKPGQAFLCDEKNAKFFVENKHALYKGAPLVKPDPDPVVIENEDDEDEVIEINEEPKPKAKKKKAK